MRTPRAHLRGAIETELGDANLLWAGIRGDDAESLADVGQFAGAFTITNAYARRPLAGSVAYEDLTGTRVDLENWDVDDHLGDPATVEYRRALFRAMSRDSVLLPYRPSSFLSAVTFARADRCRNLGLFGSHQFAFEHKPWVESALAAAGIATLDWQYIADEEQLDARRLLADGPVVLRRSRTSGGEGMVRVEDEEALVTAWPRNTEAFVAVSRYVPDALPLNVGATVWDGGHVTVHLPSVQLIGIPSCVSRPFGYCGNDFALAKDLDRATLDEIETTTVRIGRWLHRHGYRGTFGVDYLLAARGLLFTEINPRFQGSTRAAAQLAVEADEACLLLEHLAAMLHLAPPDRRPLAEATADAPDLAQMVVHWSGDTPATVDVHRLHSALLELLPSCRMDVTLPDGVLASPGAALARFIVRGSLTTNGYHLDPAVDRVVTDFVAQARSASVIDGRGI